MAQSSTTSCCSQLATLPSVDVVFPNSTAYISTEEAYWSLQEGSLTPACIVKPNTSEDVVEIISKIVANGDCHFAIKGQGHAPASGFANIENGVTIDMTGLDTISANADHSVASVGAGASWLDVYAFLDPLNKTVAGGRNGQVGVGGLTVGGGISYFSPQVGFTCDTVMNFEVVLACGKLVDANARTNPELYRALKGGTNNFGVVTRFDFNTVPIGEILAGSVASDISYREAVFEAFTNIADAPSYDVHASIVTSVVFNSSSKAWSLSSTPIYTKPVQNPPVYQDLFSVPTISNDMHLTRLSTFSNESAIPQFNALFYTGTYKAQSKILDDIFDIANSTLYDFETSASILWDLAFEPLPTIFLSHGAGENVLGTSPADGNGIVMLVSAFWSDTSLNTLIHAKAQQLVAMIDASAKTMSSLHSFVYTNYADASQDPFAGYGHQNEAFLHKVAKRYDPGGVFQTSVPGGFKLTDQHRQKQWARF